jgi:hypothetical protein
LAYKFKSFYYTVSSWKRTTLIKRQTRSKIEDFLFGIQTQHNVGEVGTAWVAKKKKKTCKK